MTQSRYSQLSRAELAVLVPELLLIGHMIDRSGMAWCIQEFGREATPEEIADEMQLSGERVRSILKMAQNPISMQSTVGDSDDACFGDFIEDKAAENPSLMTANSLLKEKLQDVLATLNERERRIAMVATQYFIRRNDYADTLRIAECLLNDEEDLIHKASGWMLRELGKRDQATLEKFLKQHQRAMPRTMLRYAIERLPPDKRRAYMAGTA